MENIEIKPCERFKNVGVLLGKPYNYHRVIKYEDNIKMDALILIISEFEEGFWNI